MPNDPDSALAHLVTHHGWSPQPPSIEMIQAHRYAHGVDGRTDLADQNLDHVHGAAAVPKKPSKIGWLAGIIGLFLVGAAITTAASDTSDDSRPSSPGTGSSSRGHTVTYKVEGTTTQASITYENANGDTSQQSDIDVPLTRQSDGGHGIVLNGMRRGAFLYISAQNSKRSGSVTCIIEVDGVVVETNTSYGGFTIATCSGRL
jgi:hypothetical protein